MTDVGFTDNRYGGPGPETYENFFVPNIGRPMAIDLVEAAELRPDERVLDVGCGTAIVARLARDRIGDAKLAALDPNPGMLEVARNVAGELRIEWHQSSAESMPLPDGAFDVVLSQMALQFVPDRAAAASEIARVLAPGGRVVSSVVGPRPEVFGHFADALTAHIGPESGTFVDAVFSLHEPDELERLLGDAGLNQVRITTSTRTLELPDPEDFLWGYIDSTPLGGVVGQASEEARVALRDDIVDRWRAHVHDGTFTVRVPVVVVTARKPGPA